MDGLRNFFGDRFNFVRHRGNHIGRAGGHFADFRFGKLHLADLEIRKQTHNQKGLQDALRGILDSGGDMREDWELTKALEIGDRSIGVNVLLPLYQRMKDKSDDKSDSMKLDSIWSQLGISSENGTVKFIDDAPLAAIRKSITAARQ